MIHECLVDQSVNRLLGHFGSLVMVRPPAHAADLLQLEEAVGPLPRCFTIFLTTCNGLCVDLGRAEPGCELPTSHRILAELVDPGMPSFPPSLVPIRGEPDRERDWLVVEPGPVYGVVIRWDPWGGGAEVMSSSFDRYLDCWSRYLVAAYDRTGARVPARRAGGSVEREPTQPLTFDGRWAGRYDPELTSLRTNREIGVWLHELNLLVGVGDDFE
jgi:hypothetical protein